MKLSSTEIKVLKLIQSTNGNISRKELSEQSGISQAGITIITKKLMQHQYIVEGEHISSGLGRKEVMLHSNPDKFTFLGIDIGGFRIRMAIANNNLEFLHTTEFLIADLQDEADKAEALLARIRLFLKESNLAEKSITAIGIGVTGIVDAELGSILDIPNAQGWNQVELVEFLKVEMKCPVFLDEVGRTMALAEKHLGKADQQDDFINVHIAFGVVAGVMSNGRLLRGASNVGGLLGHITADEQGDRCKCGNYGCLENVVTYPILEKSFKDKSGKTIPLLEAYKQNDKTAIDVCIHAGKSLGIALSNVVNLLNPLSIYLGGAIFDDFPLMFEETKRTITLRANRFATINLNLEKSSFNHHQGMYGTIVMAKIRHVYRK